MCCERHVDTHRYTCTRIHLAKTHTCAPEVGRMLSTNWRVVRDVSCVRRCAEWKCASGVEMCSQSCSYCRSCSRAPLPPWCPAGVAFIFHHSFSSIFFLFHVSSFFHFACFTCVFLFFEKHVRTFHFPSIFPALCPLASQRWASLQ